MAISKYNDPDGFFTCRRCKVLKPSTTDFYHKNCRTRSGLNIYCKECDNKRRSLAEQERKYHNLPKTCVTCGSFFYASRAWINKSIRRNAKGGIYCNKKCFAGSLSFSGKSWDGQRQGDGNPNAKLSAEKVIRVKRLLEVGISPKQIAQVLDIKRNNIYQIKYGYTWKHIN